jgi:hypothetical protein
MGDSTMEGNELQECEVAISTAQDPDGGEGNAGEDNRDSTATEQPSNSSNDESLLHRTVWKNRKLPRFGPSVRTSPRW